MIAGAVFVVGIAGAAAGVVEVVVAGVEVVAAGVEVAGVTCAAAFAVVVPVPEASAEGCAAVGVCAAFFFAKRFCKNAFLYAISLLSV